jgi:hypothetical protein
MRFAQSIALLLVGFALGHSRRAHADPILPLPTTSAVDGQLDVLAQGFQRQEDVFATAENGLSLDTTFNPGDVATVKSFFAQSADFQTATGRHPFTVVQTFGEWGDEGNFAGIASVGVAARLMVLERDAAPADQVTAARTAAVNAARAWHVFATIGGPGVVARGIRRTVPLDPSAPALPGTLPALVPLKDSAGNPLPSPKSDTWRAAVAPNLDGWIWIDDTSKDQVSGYALATAWLWDALKDDALVPPDVPQSLAADLLAFAKQLQQVAPELGIDLCIRDADGRLTDFHDLNPREITPNGVIEERLALRNGFNAALALGIIRAAYHVSGDDGIGRYYYDDLVGTRDLPYEMTINSSLAFTGATTNFSNVNMLAIALATLGRFETDPYVRSRLADTLAHQFWSTGDSRDASHDMQAWYDVVYGAYAPGVTDDIRGRMQSNLAAFQPAPAVERDIVNCDDAGVAAGVCTAIDGTTIIHLDQGPGHSGVLVANAVVPMAVRPDSDFEWRSDPFRVNGTGSSLMDPRGDWLTAYWLGRLMDTDSSKNVSPSARPPLPYVLGAADAGADAGDGSPGAPVSAQGGCDVASDGGPPWGGLALSALFAAVGAGAYARRRRASRAG